MTDTLTHTAPVPLPIEQDSGSVAAQNADTLAGRTAFEGMQPDDSLSYLSFVGPETIQNDLSWHDAAAEEVFGPASVLASQPTLGPAPAQSLTENVVFQGFVLLLAATYAILLYRNLGDICLLLSRVSRDTASGKRLIDDPGGSGFSRFLNITATIGLLFMGVMAVKYGDALVPDQLSAILPQGAVLALSLVASLTCIAIVLFQLAALRLAGGITLSQPFISQLLLLKRTYFALLVIVTAPALLLFALCPRGTGTVWFFIIVIELIITAILYLRESLNLFISKKISILHWFLYLCIVEIFPVSLLWLLAVR